MQTPSPTVPTDASPRRPTVSVVTLAHGRADHLTNVVRGLAQQTTPPDELIIAVMQGEAYAIAATPFPVRQIMLGSRELALAAARNAAAAAAAGDVLIFLDIDCIPTPALIADYIEHLASFDGLLMGEVLYLPGGATDGATGDQTAGDWRFDDFARVAVQHSDRGGPPAQGIEICTDYRCFWSLNFAMRRATFVATGGFDEGYVGYGGEDTDFGKALFGAGIPVAWMKGGLAYHQYHPHHMPPVHHLDSVIRNAERFEAKWGYRTMGHWLYAFRLMGLIDDSPGQPVRVLRRPDPRDFALTQQQSDRPFASTALVIRYLEAAAAEGRDAA